MNYLQPNAYGLDYWIQFFQTRIYDLYLKLPSVKGGLGLTDNNCLVFGRVERNQVDGQGYLPEAFYNGQYIGSDGTNTRGGLFFEKGQFIMFFGQIENKRQPKGEYRAKLELIVFTDMSIVTPQGIASTTQRLTETLLNGIENFTIYNSGFAVKETTFDIDKVLERYSGTAKRNTLTRNLSDSSNTASFGALKLILETSYDPGQNQPH